MPERASLAELPGNAMNRRAFELAAALVQWWTQIYTTGLPAEPRARRREEITSDLWEFEHGPGRRENLTSALHVLGRLVTGIPDDVGWRMEQNTMRRFAVRSTIAMAAIATVLVVMAIQSLRPPVLPAVNPAPPLEILTLARRTPPIPPPPPPPKPGER